MAKLPENHNWVKFKHKEWLTKLSIRSCDAATRGIYQDLFALAMITDETGIIPFPDKIICKQLGVKPSQFTRALKQLINVKLCVIGKNQEIILTEIASNFDLSATQQEPIEIPTGTQQEPSELPTSEQNGSLQPKNDRSYIREDNIREDKKVNPQTPFEAEELSQPEPVKTDQEVVADCINQLVQTTGLQERQCKMFVDGWLKDLDGEVHTLAHCIDRGMSGRNPINFTKWFVKNHTKINNSNVTVLQPKTNKERMTEEMGLCKNLAEFAEMYPDEEIPCESHTFGRGY